MVRPEKVGLAKPKKTPVSGVSEAQAIEQAKRGDAGAFQVLYEMHKRRVYSLCLRMTGNTTIAEDLTQEAFLQLYRKVSSFRGESAFSTWLHRMTVNVVLMHLRKKGLQQVSLDETDTSLEEPVKRDYGDEDRRLIGSIDRITLARRLYLSHVPRFDQGRDHRPQLSQRLRGGS